MNIDDKFLSDFRPNQVVRFDGRYGYTDTKHPRYFLGLSIDDLGMETGIDELNGVGIECWNWINYLELNYPTWKCDSGILAKAHYAEGVKGLLEGEFEKKTSSYEYPFYIQDLLDEFDEDPATWVQVLDSGQLFVQKFILRGISDKDSKPVDACQIKLSLNIDSWNNYSIHLDTEVSPINNKDSVGDIKAGSYSFSKNSYGVNVQGNLGGRSNFGGEELILGENSTMGCGISIEKLEDFPEDKKENYPSIWI